MSRNRIPGAKKIHSSRLHWYKDLTKIPSSQVISNHIQLNNHEVRRYPHPSPIVGPFAPVSNKASTAGMPGALSPLGFFDPIGFAEKADENTLKRYRESELTHGRVGMLAVIGFLVGKKVTGSSLLFNGAIKGPAIDHLAQVPPALALLAIAIAKVELDRAQYGWVPPRDAEDVGMLRDDYSPSDINFDPLGLNPTDPDELMSIQTKELQNGRLAMLAAVGFMAQELVDGKGILEHFGL